MSKFVEESQELFVFSEVVDKPLLLSPNLIYKFLTLPNPSLLMSVYSTYWFLSRYNPDNLKVITNNYVATVLKSDLAQVEQCFSILQENGLVEEVL